MSDMRVELLPNGTRLLQDDRFLKLGTDAILLAAACPMASRAVDLGCGVGNVLLSIADRQPDCELVGVEINPDAAAVCRQSVAENRLEHRVRVITADLREIDKMFHVEPACAPTSYLPSDSTAHANRLPCELSSAFCCAKPVAVARSLRISPHSFDLVACNPPYLRSGSGKPSPSAARNLERFDTTAPPSDVASAASALLKPHGTLMLVLRPDRLDDYLAATEFSGFAARAICHVRHTAGADPSIALLECEYLGEPVPPERTEFILSDNFSEILEGKPLCLRSTSSRPR